jgi:amidase
MQEPLERLQNVWGSRIRWTSIREIDENGSASSLENWREIYRVLLWAEAESCLGAWVAAAKPDFGPIIRQNFEMIRTLDRSTIGIAVERREKYFHRMNSFLKKNDLLCMPTTPSPAPLKGTIKQREQSGPGYYPRTLSLTSVAGVARLPQLTLPLTNLSGVPLGLSLLARNGEDAFLLQSASAIA